MTANPQRQRLTTVAILGAALAVIGTAGYVLLVGSEKQATEVAAKQATALEAEVKRAEEYLGRRADEKGVRAAAEEVAARLEQKLPRGRADLAIVQFFEQQALAAGLKDFKYDVAGGFALPEETPADTGGAFARLGADAARLRSVQISLTSTGTYRGVLTFVKAIGESPWLVEITSLELKREAQGFGLQMTAGTRYIFQ